MRRATEIWSWQDCSSVQCFLKAKYQEDHESGILRGNDKEDILGKWICLSTSSPPTTNNKNNINNATIGPIIQDESYVSWSANIIWFTFGKANCTSHGPDKHSDAFSIFIETFLLIAECWLTMPRSPVWHDPSQEWVSSQFNLVWVNHPVWLPSKYFKAFSIFIKTFLLKIDHAMVTSLT